MTLAADHDPYEVAIVEGAPALVHAINATDSPDPLPVIVEESSRRVVLRVNAARDAWLVATQSWYPGWKARVDGTRVSLVKTNYAFLGLPLSRGEHQVVLEFESDPVRMGTWISLAGLLLWLGILATNRLRR